MLAPELGGITETSSADLIDALVEKHGISRDEALGENRLIRSLQIESWREHCPES
jgi:hypothetical protein